MAGLEDFYITPPRPRWVRMEDLVAALGCTIERVPRGQVYGRADAVGWSPVASAQLVAGGRIMVPDKILLTIDVWSYIAHEAAHYVAGPWSLEDESPMLPWELSLLIRVADQKQRWAALEYMASTRIWGGFDVGDLVEDGPGWRDLPTWRIMIAAGKSHGLRPNGVIPGRRGIWPDPAGS